MPVPACPLLENQTDRVLQNKGAAKVEEGEHAVCSSGELLGEILSQNGVAENRNGPHSSHNGPRQIGREGQSKYQGELRRNEHRRDDCQLSLRPVPPPPQRAGCGPPANPPNARRPALTQG